MYRQHQVYTVHLHPAWAILIFPLRNRPLYSFLYSTFFSSFFFLFFWELSDKYITRFFAEISFFFYCCVFYDFFNGRDWVQIYSPSERYMADEKIYSRHNLQIAWKMVAKAYAKLFFKKCWKFWYFFWFFFKFKFLKFSVLKNFMTYYWLNYLKNVENFEIFTNKICFK